MQNVDWKCRNPNNALLHSTFYTLRVCLEPPAHAAVAGMARIPGETLSIGARPGGFIHWPGGLVRALRLSRQSIFAVPSARPAERIGEGVQHEHQPHDEEDEGKRRMHSTCPDEHGLSSNRCRKRRAAEDTKSIHRPGHASATRTLADVPVDLRATEHAEVISLLNGPAARRARR